MKKLFFILLALVVAWFIYDWYAAKRDLAPFTLTLPVVGDSTLLEVSSTTESIKHRVVGERIQAVMDADVALIYADAEVQRATNPDTALLPYRYDVVIQEAEVGPYYSVLLERQEYTGGAHTNYRHEDYTFVKNKQISLKEVLEREGVAEHEVYNFLREVLARDGHSEIAGLSEIQHWGVVPDAQGRVLLRVVFPPYQIAPFSEGTIIYLFPLFT